MPNQYSTILKLIETTVATYAYVGNCVDSFEDGQCSFPNYTDVNDFAVGEENAELITLDEFKQKVGQSIPNFVLGGDDDPLQYLYDRDHDVIIAYDTDQDIHYFFTR